MYENAIVCFKDFVCWLPKYDSGHKEMRTVTIVVQFHFWGSYLKTRTAEDTALQSHSAKTTTYAQK